MASDRCTRASWVGWLIALACCAAAYGVAGAQSSGGAMGGGDWGTPSGPSSADSSGYEPEPSRTRDASDDRISGLRPSGGGDGGDASDPTSEGCDGGDIFVVFVLGAFLLAGMLLESTTDVTGSGGRPGRPYTPRDGGGAARPSPRADVTMVRVVLDGRVRAPVQAALVTLAATTATNDADGRARMLGEVTLLLRRHRAMWVLGAASNHPMTSIELARVTFQRHVLSARATYRDETIRNVDGHVTTAPSDAIRGYEDGPGLVMVSVIVAARRELVTVAAPGDAEALRSALEALGSLTPTMLIAVEVIWTPSDPDDRMTSVEAERILAEADGRYARIEGAAIGVVVCAFCQQIYPAEAVACVHCGAPGVRAS